MPTTWNQLQERIWSCDLCRENNRVTCNIRQQTEAPTRPVKLMLVGVAPPYADGFETKSVAKSGTNDPDDSLRAFTLTTLEHAWEDLLGRGLSLIHAVKCAITPKDRHQNPPVEVIDVCAPEHFVQEILLAKPSTVVVFGKAPYRALLMVPGVRHSVPRGLGFSCSVTDLVDKTRGGVQVSTDAWNLRLFGSPFPLQARKQAADILREAARYVGIQ